MHYFFVTDHIQENEIKVVYFPREIMIVELHNNPLYVNMFSLLQNMLLNIKKNRYRTLYVLIKR